MVFFSRGLSRLPLPNRRKDLRIRISVAWSAPHAQLSNSRACNHALTFVERTWSSCCKQLDIDASLYLLHSAYLCNRRGGNPSLGPDPVSVTSKKSSSFRAPTAAFPRSHAAIRGLQHFADQPAFQFCTSTFAHSKGCQ